MKLIRFYKDGTKRIALDGITYKPYTLEQLLNLESAFYAGTATYDDGEPIDDIEQPTSEWFNYNGLTYIKQ